MAVYLRTAQEVQTGIAGRFKARRLAMNLTQRELAARSGVTWSSLTQKIGHLYYFRTRELPQFQEMIIASDEAIQNRWLPRIRGLDYHSGPP